MQRYKIFILIVLLLLLIPLGLLTDLPAWGEWDLSFFEKTLGFIPEGIKNPPEIIKPLIPDYSLDGKNPIISYYISALIGIGVIFGIFYILKTFSKANER